MIPQKIEIAVTPLIEEAVTVSSNAEFRNDVQLAQYRSAQNFSLARDFIFTGKAAEGRKASIDLLRLLCESYMPGASSNRFVFIATYGHGKSHLAVAIANYFGKSVDSPECISILHRLSHAAESDAVYGYFDAFKKNRKPMMILVLRGDEPSDLQTKFFRAVDEALRADEQAAGIEAPFWYSDAARYVANLLRDTPERRASADSFLSKYNLDLHLLSERIAAREASTHDIATELCLHLTHVVPAFGTGLSLKEGVEWLGNHLVGEDKPYGGVLVLFDEFSSFALDYAHRLRIRPGAPLQDLLNGVEQMRGKVTFVALAQRDPELVARTVLSGESLHSLVTQLNRLPKTQHHHLHSSLEEVLNAYLKQDPDTWEQLLRNSAFSRAIGHANDLTFDIFSKSYQDVLEWSLEHFQEIVTKGCFPLHPATTALLAGVDFEQSTNPRSVLGFVHMSMTSLRGKRVMGIELPNWVLPIALVDYFKDMLGEKPWQDYCDAIAQAGGPDASNTQIAVLKAMLLQAAGKVITKGAYGKVVATFAGLSPEKALDELQALAANGIIRYDAVGKVYTFWPAGKGANKVDQILADKLRGQVLDQSTLDVIAKELRKEGLLTDQHIPVNWGHREDWRTEQVLATRQTFTEETLRAVVLDRLSMGTDGVEKPRGLLLWLVPESVDDVSWFRNNAEDTLANAFPNQKVPIVVVRPERAEVEVARQLLRFYGLSLLSSAEISDIGAQQVQAVRELTLNSVRSGLQQLKGDIKVSVATPFRARLNLLRSRDFESVLLEVFTMAYADGIRRWFTQYKLSATKLRTSVARVATYLLTNSLSTPDIFNADPVGKDVVQKMRWEWAMLAGDSRIRHPQVSAEVGPGWQLLDSYFAAGAGPKGAYEVIRQLLNAPYGYDYNTLPLLFTAWCGYHRHDLEVSRTGKLQEVASLLKDVKPKDLVPTLGSLWVKRTDPDATRTRVDECIRRVERGSLTKKEAEEALLILKGALDRDDFDERQALSDTLTRVQTALLKVEQYEQFARVFEKEVASSLQLPDLGRHLARLKSIVEPEAVKPEAVSPSKLRDVVLARITAVTTQQCDKWKRLTDLAEYKVNEKHLSQIKSQLFQMEMPALVTAAEAALRSLEEAKRNLEHRLEDQRTLATVRSLDANSTLLKLGQHIATVESLTPRSEEASGEVTNKLYALREARRKLIRYADDLAQRVATITDRKSLESLRSDILLHFARYDGSPQARLIEQALRACDRLQTLLDATKESQTGRLQSPEDAQERLARLRQLLRGDGTSFSAAQVALVNECISSVETFVKEEERAAASWLEQSEVAVDDGRNLEKIAIQLQTPPPFLAGEQKPRLEALASNLDRRLDLRAREGAILATLNAISAKGGLLHLRHQLVGVTSLEVVSATVERLRRDKLSAIEGELAAMNAFVSSIPGRLAELRDRDSMESLRSELLRRAALFEGSDEAVNIEQWLRQCETLRDLFLIADAARLASPRSRAEAQEQIAALQRPLNSTFALGSAQRELLQECISALEEKIEKGERSAIHWLEQSEVIFQQGGELQALESRLKTPPAFFPDSHRPRLDTLHNALSDRLDDAAKEAEVIAKIEALPQKGSLAELQDHLTFAQSIPVTSDEARMAAEAKVGAIRKAIDAITTYATGIPARLDAVRDLRDLQAVHSDVLRHISQFEGSALAEDVELAEQRCVALGKYLRPLGDLAQRVPSTPAAGRELVNDIRSLCVEYASWLSDLQRALASEAELRVESFIRQEEEAALAWLERSEKALKDENDLERLARSLNDPPPFLPQPGHARLTALILDTNRVIDQDAILRVEVCFKRISDPHRRRECLGRLNAILNEDALE